MNKPYVAIQKKFVYLGKMLDFPDCYKIGSCADFIQREKDISSEYGTCDIFLIGQCLDALRVERMVQKELIMYSNKSLYGKAAEKPLDRPFPGSKNSREFFTLKPIQMFNAMHILSSHCDSFNVFPSWGEGA